MPFSDGRVWNPAPTRIEERTFELMNARARKIISHDAAGFALKELYFITICIVHKYNLLGEMCGNIVKLTELGERIASTISNINKNRKTDIITDYVIMPNHVHIVVDLNRFASNSDSTDDHYSISDLLRDFKSYTTREFNRNRTEKLVSIWQRGYYDHRIRNNEELELIKEYIKENPKRWATDKFYLL